MLLINRYPEFLSLSSEYTSIIVSAGIVKKKDYCLYWWLESFIGLTFSQITSPNKSLLFNILSHLYNYHGLLLLFLVDTEKKIIYLLTIPCKINIKTRFHRCLGNYYSCFCVKPDPKLNFNMIRFSFHVFYCRIYLL